MDGADDVDGAEERDMGGADDVDRAEERELVFLPEFWLLDFSSFFLACISFFLWTSFAFSSLFLSRSSFLFSFSSASNCFLRFFSSNIPRHSSLVSTLACPVFLVMVDLMLSNGLRCLPNSDFGEMLEWWVDGVVKMGGLCDGAVGDGWSTGDVEDGVFGGAVGDGRSTGDVEGGVFD